MLQEKIEGMVKFLNDRNETQGISYSVEYGKKWAKVIRHYNSQASAYAFVCLERSLTKALGQTEIGDIHKPASWAIPAKHKRGSVFSENYDNCLGEYGVSYLR